MGIALMALPVTRVAPSQVNTEDRKQSLIQATVQQLQQTVSNRGAPPTIVGPFTFTAGQAIAIDHKLQRQPQEWSVIDVFGGYGAFQRTAWSTTTITLQSANACTASFRVA